MQRSRRGGCLLRRGSLELNAWNAIHLCFSHGCHLVMMVGGGNGEVGGYGDCGDGGVRYQQGEGAPHVAIGFLVV